MAEKALIAEVRLNQRSLTRHFAHSGLALGDPPRIGSFRFLARALVVEPDSIV